MSKNSTNQGNPDFDWDLVDQKGFGYGYSNAERERLEDLYDGTLSTIQEKEVVKGTVVGITDREVILNIGFKSDGIVSFNEFREIEGLKIGDEIEVFVRARKMLRDNWYCLARKRKSLLHGAIFTSPMMRTWLLRRL